MTHEFLILHFAGQCPWLGWTVEQARAAASLVGGSVTTVDVAARPDLAEQYRLYFPFLTVIDGRHRLSAPTPAAALIRLARGPERSDGAVAAEQLALPTEDAPVELIEPLTAANMANSCLLCGAPPGAGCRLKSEWAADQAGSVPAGILGYIGYVAGSPAAAVEVLPASAVPYPLPAPRAGTAFVTCIYPTRIPDHRGAVLDRLLVELPGLGYKRLLVVAGRRTPFPNGPASFFARHGFREIELLVSERLRDTDEELVLMEYVR